MSHLAEYHNETVRRLFADENLPNSDEEQGLHYDACSDLAVELISSAGYEADTLDDAKVEVSDDVQTLLTLAMFRAPALREYIESILIANQ